MSLLSESKHFNDFTPEEKRQIFDVFTQSYVKATGASWDERKFYSRAGEWLFFGDPSGFITLRPQKSGYYKLTGVAGSPKSIMRAMQELTATHYPIWGMLTQDLANMLTKRFGFRMPNRLEGFIIGKLISNNVFGNVEHKRNPDGSITFNYADVGESTKVFVGNREYYKKARMDALKRVFTGKPTTNEDINEEILTEKRAVEHYYEDSFKLVSKYIRGYGYEYTYVSFRQTVNTTFINRTNKYDTPTGFYMYPLKNYQEKIATSTDMKSFMKAFPYTPESNFVFLFTLASNENILFSLKTDDEKINNYVKKIEELYAPSKPAIKTLCDLFLSASTKSFNSRISHSKTYKNSFQKFWLFLYEIAYELKSNTKEYTDDSSYFNRYPSVITKIANDIGLEGMIDDRCDGTIHPGEPCQGILFSNLRQNIANLKIVPIYQKYDTAPNIDNPDAPIVDKSEYKRKYEIYLAKKLNVNYIQIVDDSYQINIKNRLPFIILTDKAIPYYIDRDGNLSVKGINTDKIFANNEDDYDDKLKQDRTAYINSLYKTKYVVVGAFGRYGGDIAITSSDNDTVKFINKEGMPDITGVDVNKINSYERRADYFNQLLGNEMFTAVTDFKEYGGEIALATPIDGTSYFINKSGNPDITGVDLTKVTDSRTRVIILNQKSGKNYFDSVGDFNKYGQGIALALTNKGNKLFINTEGKPTIANININNINDGDFRATYMNQKLRKKLFNFISKFGIYGADVAIGKYIDGTLKFINVSGKPDVNAVDFNKIDAADTRATYMNQKYETDFTSVGLFDKIGDDVAYAVHEDGTIEFINREGKPSMGNVDINRIDDSHVRAVFVNKLLGTNYTHVDKFGYLGGDVALASNPDNKTYEFINREGKKDITGVELDKIRGADTRAIYFNQKYGTKYDNVFSFGEFGDNAALAYEEGKGKFFINKEGVPDTSGVDLSTIEDSSNRAIYFNQKSGTKYQHVADFGRYAKNIGIATDYYGNKVFINRNGKKSVLGVNPDDLSNSELRAIYFNQKYKTNYKTVSDFGQYGENIAVATDDNEKKFFINKQGKPDISGIDLKKLKQNSYLLAQYFNTINGTNYSDIVTPSSNIKTNAMFASVPNSHNGHIFVNSKGKPNLKITNLQQVIDYYGKDTIDDVIALTKKALAGKLKENYSILHSIINEEVMNYFQ